MGCYSWDNISFIAVYLFCHVCGFLLLLNIRFATFFRKKVAQKGAR